MRESNRRITRRQFIGQAGGAGLVATGGTLVSAAVQRARAASQSNPFAYEVDRFAKTDPKLVRFEQKGKFAAGNPEPRRIAVGPDQRLYVAGRSGLTVLDRNGEQVLHAELPAPARCVAVARDGTIYMGMRDHVAVLDAKGRRLKDWDNPGKKAWLTGLAAGENDLFAADSGNRVILRYDRSGKLVGRIGEKNKERNVPGLIVPSPYLDVDLAKDGLLRVNNPGRHCVDVYTVQGDFELSWGKASAVIQGFCGCCNPIALAVLPDGRCVTCEKGLPRVKVYSADGTFECVVAGPESFPENAKAGSVHDLSDGTMGGLDAAVDGEGVVYILDLVAGDIRVMQKKA
jgi:hypothetical protein